MISAVSLPAVLQLVAANGPAAFRAEAVRCYLADTDMMRAGALGSRAQRNGDTREIQKDDFGMRLWRLFSCVGSDFAESEADADENVAGLGPASEASSPLSSPVPPRAAADVRWESQTQTLNTLSISVATPLLFPPSSGGYRRRQGTVGAEKGVGGGQGGGGWRDRASYAPGVSDTSRCAGCCAWAELSRYRRVLENDFSGDRTILERRGVGGWGVEGGGGRK